MLQKIRKKGRKSHSRTILRNKDGMVSLVIAKDVDLKVVEESFVSTLSPTVTCDERIGHVY